MYVYIYIYIYTHVHTYTHAYIHMSGLPLLIVFPVPAHVLGRLDELLHAFKGDQHMQ